MDWATELTLALISPPRPSVEIGWRQEIAVTATLVAIRMELRQEARIFLERSAGEMAFSQPVPDRHNDMPGCKIAILFSGCYSCKIALDVGNPNGSETFEFSWTVSAVPPHLQCYNGNVWLIKLICFKGTKQLPCVVLLCVGHLRGPLVISGRGWKIRDRM